MKAEQAPPPPPPPPPRRPRPDNNEHHQHQNQQQQLESIGSCGKSTEKSESSSTSSDADKEPAKEATLPPPGPRPRHAAAAPARGDWRASRWRDLIPLLERELLAPETSVDELCGILGVITIELDGEPDLWERVCSAARALAASGGGAEALDDPCWRLSLALRAVDERRALGVLHKLADGGFLQE